jgi:hypothetical protein
VQRDVLGAGLEHFLELVACCHACPPTRRSGKPGTVDLCLVLLVGGAKASLRVSGDETSLDAGRIADARDEPTGVMKEDSSFAESGGGGQAKIVEHPILLISGYCGVLHMVTHQGRRLSSGRPHQPLPHCHQERATFLHVLP